MRDETREEWCKRMLACESQSSGIREYEMSPKTYGAPSSFINTATACEARNGDDESRLYYSAIQKYHLQNK